MHAPKCVACTRLVLALSMLPLACCTADVTGKPHIVIIMADDLGFDDVSFRGSNEFLTPNIDALAYSGIILNNLYTPTMCTPSRSALLTGKYPINTGMQHYVIPNDEPWGLPLNETTIADIFGANGYHTSLFGKWHVGFSREAFTPTKRGFHKHYGYLGAYMDYYTQMMRFTSKNYSEGHDFRDNLHVSRNRVGTYVTDLLTEATVQFIQQHDVSKQPMFLLLSHMAVHAANDDDPLQAPAEELQKFSYIEDMDRRIYAAMVSKLDESVGQVIEALAEKGILNNTIVLLYSDNGGPTVGQHANTASNYPHRGQKNSPWEGGIRSSAAIWSPMFEKLGTVWRQKIYVADFLPTLAAAAGLHLNPNLKLDGLNLWSALKYGYESVEREIVHNIDEIADYVAYVKGKWKFINGTTENGIYDSWLGHRADDASALDPRHTRYEEIVRNTSVWQHLSNFNAKQNETDIAALRAATGIRCQLEYGTENVPCYPLIAPCLFDIDADPCEQNNLYEQHKNTKLVTEMLERISYYRDHAHPPNNMPFDPRCNPINFHNEWTWWEDELERGAGTDMCAAKYLLGSIIGGIYVMWTQWYGF